MARPRTAALTLAAMALAIAGCSSTSTTKPAASAAGASPTIATGAPSPSPSPSVEPPTYDAVKAAVDKIDAAAKAQDGGTGWDMLTGSGQATMSRADYIKVVNGCPKWTSTEETLSIALNASGTTATITASAPPELGGGTFTWIMVYEGGHWKHQPSASAMEWMGMGADKALRVLHNESAC